MPNFLRISTYLIITLAFGPVCAQLKSEKLYKCTKPVGIPFSIKLNGGSAQLSLKGNTFDLDYKESWVGPNGDRWTVYKDSEVIVSAVGADKYVSVKSAAFPNAHPISICVLD